MRNQHRVDHEHETQRAHPLRAISFWQYLSHHLPAFLVQAATHFSTEQLGAAAF
jgi:hypothetical protein